MSMASEPPDEPPSRLPTSRIPVLTKKLAPLTAPITKLFSFPSSPRAFPNLISPAEFLAARGHFRTHDEENVHHDDRPVDEDVQSGMAAEEMYEPENEEEEEEEEWIDPRFDPDFDEDHVLDDEGRPVPIIDCPVTLKNTELNRANTNVVTKRFYRLKQKGTTKNHAYRAPFPSKDTFPKRPFKKDAKHLVWAKQLILPDRPLIRRAHRSASILKVSFFCDLFDA